MAVSPESLPSNKPVAELVDAGVMVISGKNSPACVHSIRVGTISNMAIHFLTDLIGMVGKTYTTLQKKHSQ
jgi:hypothetical protein